MMMMVAIAAVAVAMIVVVPSLSYITSNAYTLFDND